MSVPSLWARYRLSAAKAALILLVFGGLTVLGVYAETRSPHEARLLELDREALEEAYKAQVMHLFNSWMKDHTGQPDRAAKGVALAREAYIGAMEKIDERRRGR